MKETSFRTLMLMTTLFAVIVIFQATVRPLLPRAVQAQPVRQVGGPQDPNKTPNMAGRDQQTGNTRSPDATYWRAKVPRAHKHQQVPIPESASGNHSSSLLAGDGRVTPTFTLWPTDEQENPDEPNEPNEPLPPVPE